jgi:drug/metabolite transporter (DMT)-like permease
VFGISFAGPLIRLSAAHPLSIATWRLGIAMLVIVPLAIRGGGWRQWRTLSAADLLICLAAGVSLALHFWTWNTSVGMTTVAASVVLVNLQPVIVASGSALWLREPPTPRQWLGVFVAMIGAVVVVSDDLMSGGLGGNRRALFGDALALAGAVTAAAYYLAGRRVRQKMDLWPYVSLVYGACLFTLLALVLTVQAPLWPQPPRELLIFAALAIGPMLLGHTGMNWALGLLPAYVVNVALLGEPLVATLLAMFIPAIREVPSVYTVAGGALILAGIVVTSRSVKAKS